MSPRQISLPVCWLMTDERMGDALFTAVRRLPRGAGVIFRHYGSTKPQRRALARKIVHLGRSRRLRVGVAGSEEIAKAAGAHWVHNRDRHRSMLTFSASVHSAAELRRALGQRVSAIFLSPMFPTNSHPGTAPMPRMRAAALIRLAGTVRVYALGGVDARRFRTLRGLGFYGWAGIDAWQRIRT